MQMTPEDWERVKELFLAATESDQTRRAGILAAAGSGVVRREVERLLREHDGMGSFLSAPAFADKRTQMPPDTEVSTIGRYRLFEKIGEGGMGEVWLAEQTDPVRRRVALKVIRAGMGSREVIARFQSERQALALMDHPAIAKVLDAGSTEQGAPYFVMEYVAGVPITTYCDQHRLDLRERLRLFTLVCEGVQHAHQKAIIHRDLKPSNILVTEIDGKPVPKIIDFGVAKALSQKLTEDTLYTRAGSVIGTLEYMSPEQALSMGEDIDTRTDVYSLGVIFYELLSGAPPLGTQKVAFDEFLRQLKEEDAPRPSTRIRTLDPQTGTALATARRTEPKILADELRGELDWIALKALDKNRNRRYSSPGDLARDILRYLSHETVSAVPPSAAYRLRKFARRYRASLVMVASILTVLAAATFISLRQSIRASREAAVSTAISDFLRHDLLEQADPSNQARGLLNPHLTVRSALDNAAHSIQGRFAKQPEVEAALRESIGRTYLGLEQFKSAQVQFQRTAEIDRRLAGDQSPTTLKALSELGNSEVFIDPVQAESILTSTLEKQRRVLGPENPDTIATLSALAWANGEQGKQAECLRLLKQVLELRQRILGSEHPDTLATMHDLAGSYWHGGEFAESEALYRRTFEIQRRLFGPEDPGVLVTMDDLSNPIWAQGRRAEAESILKQALEIDLKVLGYEHPTTIDTMATLAQYNVADGQYTLATSLWEKLVETMNRTDPNGDYAYSFENSLAWTILLNPDRSQNLMNRAEDIARADFKHDPKDPAFNGTLSLAEYRLGHWKQAIEAAERSAKEDSAPTPDLFFLLSMAHWRALQKSDALSAFQKGVNGTVGKPRLSAPERDLWAEAARLLGKAGPQP
jgi:eukaryotic-like serine/threonine-protein kinase